MNIFLFYFILFIIYSFMGWFIEMFVSNVIMKKGFVNRGFLIGPYCPIYGFSSLAIILILGRYKDDIFVLFLSSLVICSVAEYLTSYLMEKIFKVRWWDYTDEPYNINGRICLLYSFGFGLLGVLLIQFINPFLEGILLYINSTLLTIITIFIISLFILDILLSFNIIFKIKKNFTVQKKDSTNEIYSEIKKEIKKKNHFIIRIFNAFPYLKEQFFKKSKN